MMQYIKRNGNIQEQAKIRYLESKASEQEGKIEELKSNNELLVQCVLEMSEMIYQ